MNTIDRKNPPRIKDAVEFNLQLKPYDKYTLNNGVDVYAIDAGAEDVLMLDIVYYAGNWFEDQNLIAASTNFLIKNGTTKKNAFQLNEHFDYYGSYLNRNCFNETATITLHSLSKYLPELLPVIREVLTDAVFPEEEINTYKQNAKQRLKVNLRKSDFVANRFVDAYVYGEQHPYGKYTRFEDFDTVTREQLIAFYQKYYTNGKFVIFVAGKLPADLFQQLNKNLGDLKNQPVTVADIAVQPATEKKFRVTNDVKGVQGSIRLATPFPNRHHNDFMKVQVVNNLFGGFFGSRLMQNIREDKGYTYGIYSFIQNHIQQSAWVITTEAGKDVCEAAITEVYKEMELLRTEPVEKDELLLVQNFMMGSILGDLDGPFQILNRWKNIILNGLDEQYFYDQINTIKNIKAEEIQQLSEKYLQPENFYELVVV